MGEEEKSNLQVEYGRDELSSLDVQTRDNGDLVFVKGRDLSDQTRDMLAFVGDKVCTRVQGIPSGMARDALKRGDEVRPGAYALFIRKDKIATQKGEPAQYVLALVLDTRNARGVQRYRDELKQLALDVLGKKQT